MILDALPFDPDFLDQERARAVLAEWGGERLADEVWSDEPGTAVIEVIVRTGHGRYVDVGVLAAGRPRPVAGPALLDACACGTAIPRHLTQCLRCAAGGTVGCRSCGTPILAKYRYCPGCAHAVAARYALARGPWKGGPAWTARCPYHECGEPCGLGQMMCERHWDRCPPLFKAAFLRVMARDHRGPAWEEDMAELVDAACAAVSERSMQLHLEENR